MISNDLRMIEVDERWFAEIGIHRHINAEFVFFFLREIVHFWYTILKSDMQLRQKWFFLFSYAFSFQTGAIYWSKRFNYAIGAINTDNQNIFNDFIRLFWKLIASWSKRIVCFINLRLVINWGKRNTLKCYAAQ